MKTSNVFCFVLLLTISYSKSRAQSEGYTIESFQDVYTELSNFESVGILAEGNPIWDLEFPFNFEFPFYDSLYTYLIYRFEAWGSVTDTEDFSLLLMDFNMGYIWDEINDTTNITSDVRYAHVFSNNLQAFVLEFHKMGFFGDPYTDPADTYFSFQLWFYENGVMEVHFGENHLDATPIYESGKGFYCYTTSGGVDTSSVCGPHMGISNPADENDAIGLSGSYDDFEISGDLYSVLNTLPPEGWIIRFKPKTVGFFEPKQTIKQLDIIPNPTNDYIEIPVNSSLIIFDFFGKEVYQGRTNENRLNVSELAAGMYFIRITSESDQSLGRFVKL